MFGEERNTSEVKFSELEMGLSSSDDLIEVEGDTIASVPLSSLSPPWRELGLFTLLRSVHLMKRPLLNLWKGFSFLLRLGFFFLEMGKSSTLFPMGRCVSIRRLS